MRPVDGSDVLWLSANSTYLFGKQTGSNPANAQLWRRDAAGTEAVLFDFADNTWIGLQGGNFTATSNEPVVHTIAAFDAVIFVDLRDQANIHFIYRSTDGGSTFTESLKLGEVGATHYSNMSMLGDRGMAFNGTKYVVGEYNTRAETSGDGSKVRLYATSNQGSTWDTVWDANGATYVTNQIHTVRYDDNSKNFYIGCGDGDTSGIIQWDGVTDITGDNATDFPDFTTTPAIGSTKRYQTTDLVFVDGNILNPSDNLNTSGVDDGEQGVWLTTPGFGNYLKKTALNAQFAYHNLFWGVVWGDYVLCNEIVNGSATGTDLYEQYIYGCHKSDLDNWQIYGRMVMNNSFVQGALDGFLVFNDQLVISSAQWPIVGLQSYFFERGEVNTEITKDFEQDNVLPEIMAPIFWVNKDTGNDSNSGERPDDAWASVEKACTPNSVSQGARVMVSPGAYTSGDFQAGFSTVGDSAAYGDTQRIPTVIEGDPHCHIDATVTIEGNGTADGNGNYPNNEPVRFVNCSVKAVTLSGAAAFYELRNASITG